MAQACSHIVLRSSSFKHDLYFNKTKVDRLPAVEAWTQDPSSPQNTLVALFPVSYPTYRCLGHISLRTRLHLMLKHVIGSWWKNTIQTNGGRQSVCHESGDSGSHVQYPPSIKLHSSSPTQLVNAWFVCGNSLVVVNMTSVVASRGDTLQYSTMDLWTFTVQFAKYLFAITLW